MKIIESVDENEVIWLFLSSSLHSVRFHVEVVRVLDSLEDPNSHGYLF